ncbi:hypothetical protein RRG08_044185 [Elysia crispata]|uniref:Uncharacterized protein n=1 Tax=Elysia crispata TaxID=231223 RepID=A0AAE0XX60_9GAST|nr:hypothetical protein RRG08_044185 [Elysia crispata]
MKSQAAQILAVNKVLSSAKAVGQCDLLHLRPHQAGRSQAGPRSNLPGCASREGGGREKRGGGGHGLETPQPQKGEQERMYVTAGQCSLVSGEVRTRGWRSGVDAVSPSTGQA